MRGAIASLIGFLFGALTSTTLFAETLKLNGIDPVRTLGSYTAQYADPTRTLTLDDVLGLLSESEFSATTTSHFDAGYSITPYWIALPVENTSNAPIIYRLSSNIPYVPALSVWLVGSDGQVETLLEKQTRTPWLAEQFLGQSVVAAPFKLDNNSKATLVARFEPYGIGILPLSLETERSALDRATWGNRIAGPFYSFAITSLVLLFMFVVAMRHPGGLNYLFLFGAALVMLAQLDGYWNQWIWPEYPHWNKVASFPMLLLLCAAGFKTSSYMLRTSGAERLAGLSSKMTLASFLPLLAVPWVEIAWLILIGFGLMATGMALLAYAIIDWAKLFYARTWIALGIGCTFFLSIGIILINVLSGQGELSEHNLILTKALYALITIILMISYATHVAALNRANDRAIQRELEFARNESRISAELLASERRYAHAQSLATHHQNRLADASHDLRQPLASLRLTYESLARGGGAETKEAVTRSFEYLEELLNRNLDEDQGAGADIEKSGEAETLRASLITETVAEMFSEEAAAKGLELRHFESSAVIHVQPMPVMRIVSNLVSNAVKHTQSGGILIGARQRGETVAIDVCDTGPGMSAIDMETMRRRNEKGAQSKGKGLGLAICYELAVLHGFDLDVRSRLGRGSHFRLSVPRFSKALSD